MVWYTAVHHKRPSPLPPMSQALQQRAYDHIRHMLVSGQLPPGVRISERALATKIGISRTPVREALGKLRNEGLLDHVHGFGTFARMPSRRELIELYELRLWLETGAVTKAARRIEADDLQRLRDLCAQMRALADSVPAPTRPDNRDAYSNEGRWLTLDTAFHVSILEAAGNVRALSAVRDLHIMTQIFGHRRERLGADDMRRIADDHDCIVAALACRDARGARRRLIEHLRIGRRAALAAFDDRRRRQLAGQNPPPDLPASVRDQILSLEQGTQPTAPA